MSMEIKVKYKSMIKRSIPDLLYSFLIIIVLNLFLEISVLYKIIFSISFMSFVVLRIIFNHKIYIVSVLVDNNLVTIRYFKYYTEKSIMIDIDKLKVEYGGMMVGGGITKTTLIFKKEQKKILRQCPTGYWNEDNITELFNILSQ